MARAVVSPTLFRLHTTSGIRDTAPGDDGAEPTGVSADQFAERLVKYVPAEALSFFIFATALFDRGGIVVGAGVVALIGAVLLALLARSDLPYDLRPPALMTVGLTGAAFLAWALGTSPALQDVLGVSAKVGAFALACAAFALPIVDESLMRVLHPMRGSP